MARSVLTRFAEINPWQLALRLRRLGKMNGRKPASLGGKEGLTRFTTRKCPVTQKQAVFPRLSDAARARLRRASPSRSGGQHRRRLLLSLSEVIYRWVLLLDQPALFLPSAAKGRVDQIGGMVLAPQSPSAVLNHTVPSMVTSPLTSRRVVTQSGRNVA